MKWTKRIHKTTITALSATLIMVSGWSAPVTSVHAAPAPATCGTGDHGLLQACKTSIQAMYPHRLAFLMFSF